MILYLDTSALVKLYVRERGSKAVKTLVEDSEAVGTSIVAFPEARAAFARRVREGGLSERSHKRVIKGLEQDWPAFVSVELTQALAREAGRLASSERLRGFDAVHLASALELGRLSGVTPHFACYDVRLSEAAARCGLTGNN